MKKILTMALCLGVCGTAFAQKAVVDQASKMFGKADKLPEARELIKQAAANPETAKDARTYYTGGKLEYEVYDVARTKQMINPKDESINPVEMGKQLLAGYDYFLKALPLDSLPDEKGKVKPKYSKDIYHRLNTHFNDYFNAGGAFYNNKMYYPEAYEAFMIYADMPRSAYAEKFVANIPDSVINTAYFNAGLSAFAGDQHRKSAAAFKKARLNNSDNVQNYIYELACWQNIAQRDTTAEAEAKKEIEEIAMAGYNKFGVDQMIFVNNLINSWLQEDRNNEALKLVSDLISKNSDNAGLYGLRGFIYDRMDKDDESVADYNKAASITNCDVETLKNAGRKLFKVGTSKLNAIEGNNPAARNEIKTNYFEAAKTVMNRAKTMSPDDPDVDTILESIDYALTTYFN